jgi:lipoprotein-anchoring transpeptidase ErfK/SrfK
MEQLKRKIWFCVFFLLTLFVLQACLPTPVSAAEKRLIYKSKTRIVRTQTRAQVSPPVIDSGNPADKTIIISLSRETLTAYQGSQVVLQTSVTTGGPRTRTPAGAYQVLAKQQNFVMHSPWPRSDSRWYPNSLVHYGLLFDDGGYYIHDAPWRRRFGVGSNVVNGRPGGNSTGTHGCVNVPSGAEARLFHWASVGTRVIVEI